MVLLANERFAQIETYFRSDPIVVKNRTPKARGGDSRLGESGLSRSGVNFDEMIKSAFLYANAATPQFYDLDLLVIDPVL